MSALACETCPVRDRAACAVLDEAVTAELFRKYIAEIDEKTAQRLRLGFHKVLTDMAQSAAHAEGRAERFGGMQ